MGQFGIKTYECDAVYNFLDEIGNSDNMNQKEANVVLKSVFAHGDHFDRLGVVIFILEKGLSIPSSRLKKALEYANEEFHPDNLNNWGEPERRKTQIQKEINIICSALDNKGKAKPQSKTIELPCFGIEVNLTGDGGGSITSNLHEEPDFSTCTTNSHRLVEMKNAELYNTACDALESFILSCACSGVDIESFSFLEAIETTVQGIASNMD